RHAPVEGGDAAGIEAKAGGENVAEDHLVDLSRLELGPPDRLADDEAAELGRRDLGERAAERADRGAGRADDDWCTHRTFPPTRESADCSTARTRCTITIRRLDGSPPGRD